MELLFLLYFNIFFWVIICRPTLIKKWGHSMALLTLGLRVNGFDSQGDNTTGKCCTKLISPNTPHEKHDE